MSPSRPVLLLLALALLAAAPASSQPTPAPPSRPNILWLVSEDNGRFLGCYGDKQARTPTLDKLAREGVRDQQRAIQTHNQVGQEVRAAIKRIGGALPENIPPAEHIKQVRKRIAPAPPKLQLDDKDANGLAGGEGASE